MFGDGEGWDEAERVARRHGDGRARVERDHEMNVAVGENADRAAGATRSVRLISEDAVNIVGGNRGWE